ncbi:hypothetical protein D5086_025359 [Populus alba]|uniref:Uncharacterized protein n=1 Tax=Populus alba TaxID=43335 RepID=A0ACC4AZ97_POPAL
MLEALSAKKKEFRGLRLSNWLAAYAIYQLDRGKQTVFASKEEDRMIRYQPIQWKVLHLSLSEREIEGTQRELKKMKADYAKLEIKHAKLSGKLKQLEHDVEQAREIRRRLEQIVEQQYIMINMLQILIGMTPPSTFGTGEAGLQVHHLPVSQSGTTGLRQSPVPQGFDGFLFAIAGPRLGVPAVSNTVKLLSQHQEKSGARVAQGQRAPLQHQHRMIIHHIT